MIESNVPPNMASSPFIRLFECSRCDYLICYEGLDASRPSLVKLERDCPKCGLVDFIRVPNGFPQMAMGNHGGMPNDSQDEAGYEGWQRNRWKTLEDKLHVDNAGTERIATDSILPKSEFGKDF